MKNRDGSNKDGTESNSLKRKATLHGRKAFLNELATGNVDKSVNETTIMEIAYHEARVAEMQQEIDTLRRSIATKQGQNKAVANFVDQLVTKDGLLIEKDRKLYDLSN